jgi:thiol-disulfide isomerase/thioredoxin
MKYLLIVFISSSIFFTEIPEQKKYIETLLYKPSTNLLSYLSSDQIKKIETNKPYMYVDVWASWCGPCIANLKFLNRIPDSSFTSNTNIIALNIDSTTERWLDFSKKYITNTKIIDIHLNKIQKDKFLLNFNILAIPRYLLFDKSGNLVSSECPGPSNPELIMNLNSLK